MQIRCLFEPHQVGNQTRVSDQITNSQTWHQDLGKTALEDPWRPLHQGADRRFGDPVVIELTVRFILDQRQTIFIQHGRNVLPRLDAITGTGRILKTRDEISKARFVIPHLSLEQFQIQSRPLQGDALTLGLKQTEGLQCRQISGRFNQHAALRIDKQLGDQIQPLLGTGEN